MKSVADIEPNDWREQLPSLPSSTEPFLVLDWLLKAALCLGVAFVGSLFVLMTGPAVGLSIGIGPEQIGSADYLLIGGVLNVFAGAAVFALASRCAISRTTLRLIFYSFTAPTFLVVLYLGFGVVASLFP